MRIYIAGPLSKGDVAQNVRKAIEAAEILWKFGHTPFVPHLYHFWHLIAPQTYEDWMNLDRAWLECCDGLFRLPGESLGADREVAWAQELGLPIFFDWIAFTKWVWPVNGHVLTPPAFTRSISVCSENKR